MLFKPEYFDYSYDGETFFDSTVFVFYDGEGYDCFIRSVFKPEEVVFKSNNIRIHPLEEMSAFMKGKTVIGFNNKSFDDSVVYYMEEQEYMMTPTDVFNYAQDLIDGKQRGYGHPKLKSIDVMTMKHYDGAGRNAGLKWLNFSTRNLDITDLPFSHTEEIKTVNRLKDLIVYCMKDTFDTYNFAEVCKKDFKLRHNLNVLFQKKYPKWNCLSWSDVKIGEQRNLLKYCEVTGADPKKLYEYSKSDKPKPKVNFSECIPDYINFKTEFLREKLKELKEVTIHPFKDKKKNRWVYSKFRKEVTIGNLNLIMGSGGLHSVDRAGIIEPKADEHMEDADVGSMYPARIAKGKIHPSHLTVAWAENIEESIFMRMDYKSKIKSGDEEAKSISDMLKLSMNGGAFGMLNMEYGWQYDPIAFFSVTVACQLELLMLIERFTLEGFKVVSVNTDGIVCIYKKEDEARYHEVCTEWEIEIGNIKYGKLEFKKYSKMVRTSGNHYIGIGVDGSLKRKGSFMIYEDYQDDAWHKNPSGLIIPLALQEYFVKAIPVEQTINNHNIAHDFMFGIKRKKKTAYVQMEQKLGKPSVYTNNRVIRYYVSNEGMFLYKIHKKFKMARIQKGFKTKLALKMESDFIESKNKRPYADIDKLFYINSAKKLIDKIEAA